MQLIHAFANTFQVTPFDVILFLLFLVCIMVAYYFSPLRTLYEIAFGAMVGLGIYVLLSILLIGNAPMGTSG